MKCIAILLAVVALASAVHPTVTVAEEQRRVSFEPGASSATIKGQIKGYDGVDYVLGAKTGQTMHVTLKTSNAASYFNVLPPGSDTAIGRGDISGNDWTGTLPVDGDYIVRVYLMRSAARRNETASYTLTVGIAGSRLGAAPTGDAKVQGTPYHATGKVPCSFGPDPKGSAQCSFGVIRGAPGNAEVQLAPPGYDVTRHRDQVENVLIFEGNSVKSRDLNQKVIAEKMGDEWSISIDGFRFYTIPEAVIIGG
jgi:hypothetical protein